MKKYVFVVIVEITFVWCQFSDHVDLQKISEIIYKGEKYNVLKPTVHMVEDYFREFMTKQARREFPTKRVFIDRDGFRHYWKGMKISGTIQSLRKADLLAPPDQKLSPDKKQTTTPANKVTTRKVKETPKRSKATTSKTIIMKPVKAMRQEATQIVTTFFCPHFGVIKMTAQVDNFDNAALTET